MRDQKYFGNLTLKEKKLYNINQILKKDNKELDALFNGISGKLEMLTVIEAEREEALQNLRLLTSLLQTKRLRNKVKSKVKYFTL
ncbi:MAG: hypothetical protein E7Z90_07170 [Cyanobacteria bacterium SIG29]|nr:hypothetical protein [Cyanobacteria bacterium SIG29]